MRPSLSLVQVAVERVRVVVITQVVQGVVDGRAAFLTLLQTPRYLSVSAQVVQEQQQTIPQVALAVTLG
jgi:hypothetical protein